MWRHPPQWCYGYARLFIPNTGWAGLLIPDELFYALGRVALKTCSFLVSLSKRNGGGMKGWNWWSLDYSKRRGERRERGSLAFALFGVKFDSGREDTRNTGSEKRGWEGERGTLTWKERKAFKARWWLNFYLALFFRKTAKIASSSFAFEFSF